MKCPYEVGAVLRGSAGGGVYRLVRRVGDGASAFVFEADDGQGERVALKLLRQGASPARMQRECRALQGLRHPCIVRLVDFGITDAPHRLPYLVMPLLGGAPLRAVLDRQGALGLERGIDHGIELFAALAHAHRGGIVHRDVRPENVFLERSAPRVHRLVLLDFDLAYVPSRLPTAQGLTGDPRYAAPELLYGGTPSFASDLYAAGLVLFEMWTGAHALAVSSNDWRSTHSFIAPPALGAVLPGASPALARLTAALLAKHARERPSSAESCAETPEHPSGRAAARRPGRPHERGCGRFAAPAHRRGRGRRDHPGGGAPIQSSTPNELSRRYRCRPTLFVAESVEASLELGVLEYPRVADAHASSAARSTTRTSTAPMRW